jgi:hypothetical protein
MAEREQPTRRAPTKQALMHAAPWLPAPYDLADVSALKALQAGTASAEQQLRALTWIIENACGTYDFPYRPGGQEGERDTGIALGRMFVGQQIVKLLNVPMAALRRREPNADPHDPTTA